MHVRQHVLEMSGNRNEYESIRPNYSSTPVIEKPPKPYPNSVSPSSTISALSMGNGSSYALLGKEFTILEIILLRFYNLLFLRLN